MIPATTLVLVATVLAAGEPAFRTDPAAVPREHPYLLGSRAALRELARARRADYDRTAAVARDPSADDHPRMISIGLVCAIDGDPRLAREAIDLALRRVDGPIQKGHVPFGSELAVCGLVFDLCHEHWTPEERARFHDWFCRTVDANVESETHVFHNGWYGYKSWGIGIAAYAGFHENPRAPAILAELERDYRERAAPALRLAGAGGGFAEGYYIHYWLHEWLFFCEVARRCGGPDYHALAPEFYEGRAVASMFEMVPGIAEYGSRRPVPMGDGGGRVFGGDRDKALFAREILVTRRRDDPVHRAVAAFDAATPRSSVGVYAWMDLLWRDRTVPPGDLRGFRLSHLSPGPGHVLARSSWEEDATHFSFRCGDRFTAHQHLDAGHFTIFRRGELAGDGGHYDGFGTPHDVNYHLRTVAHSTIRVLDPEETWPGIRAGDVTSNDGGQHHAWPHHNGAVVDPAAWEAGRKLYDIADIVAFVDAGEWLYVAGDATRAYSPAKLELFTRRIVYLRPGTFVILDRVRSRAPELKKTWTLQAVSPPTGAYPDVSIANGKGRLWVRSLLPRRGTCETRQGADLYRLGGREYPPQRDTGPAPVCRIEIFPAEPAIEDLFLNVLVADDVDDPAPPKPRLEERAGEVRLTVGRIRMGFAIEGLAGWVETPSGRRDLPAGVILP